MNLDVKRTDEGKYLVKMSAEEKLYTEAIIISELKKELEQKKSTIASLEDELDSTYKRFNASIAFGEDLKKELGQKNEALKKATVEIENFRKFVGRSLRENSERALSAADTILTNNFLLKQKELEKQHLTSYASSIYDEP